MHVLQLSEFHIGPCAITQIQHILKCVLPRAVWIIENYEVIGNIRPSPHASESGSMSWLDVGGAADLGGTRKCPK